MIKVELDKANSLTEYHKEVSTVKKILDSIQRCVKYKNNSKKRGFDLLFELFRTFQSICGRIRNRALNKLGEVFDSIRGVVEQLLEITDSIKKHVNHVSIEFVIKLLSSLLYMHPSIQQKKIKVKEVVKCVQKMKTDMIKLIHQKTNNYIATVTSIINLMIETAKAILGQSVSKTLDKISAVLKELHGIFKSPSVLSIIKFVKSVANMISTDGSNNALVAGIDTATNFYNAYNDVCHNVDTFADIRNYSLIEISEEAVKGETDLFRNAFANNPAIQQGATSLRKIGKCYKNIKQFCDSREHSARTNEIQNFVSKQLERMIVDILNKDKQFKYLLGYWQKIETQNLSNENDEKEKERIRNIVTYGLSATKIYRIAKESNINNVLRKLLGSMLNDDLFNLLGKIATRLEKDPTIENCLQLMTTKIVNVLKKDLQKYAKKTEEQTRNELTMMTKSIDDMLSDLKKTTSKQTKNARQLRKYAKQA